MTHGSTFGIYSHSSGADFPMYNYNDRLADLYLNDVRITDLEIPDGVTCINGYTFAHTTVKTGSIPDSVCQIEENAFANSPLATTFVDGVAYADKWAIALEDTGGWDFEDDSSEEETAQSITLRADTVGIADVFCSWRSLTVETLTLPKILRYIGKNAFGGNEIQKLQIEAGAELQKIGEYAFSYNALTEVDLPETLESIGSGAFSGCSDLVKVTVRSENCEFPVGESLAFPKDTVLYGYKGSTTEQYAKQYGNSFVELAVQTAYTGSCGENLTYTLDTETGVLTVSGTGAMPDYYASTPAPWSIHASYVRTVTVCEGVTRVGNMAFDGCENLESLSLPTTLTAMGASMPSLSPLYLAMPEGEIRISGWLVGYKGTKPKNLVLSEGIVGIADNVFVFETIETAVLPRSLRYIGRDVFSWCQNLTDVTVLNPQCRIESDMAYLPFPQSTALHGVVGSTTQTYAENFGNSFIALGRETGDIDGDGTLTVRDVLLALQILLDGGFDGIADLDGDGALTLVDVIRILRAVT